jgi:hypothetical protein
VNLAPTLARKDGPLHVYIGPIMKVRLVDCSCHPVSAPAVILLSSDVVPIPELGRYGRHTVKSPLHLVIHSNLVRSPPTLGLKILTGCTPEFVKNEEERVSNAPPFLGGGMRDLLRLY